MLRSQADKYNTREVFRHKKSDEYIAISWNSFKEQAENISCYLVQHGIQAKDNIGIFSNNCPQWTCTDLGIMSTRAVVVPIYATATFEQLKYIVEETEMQILFVGDPDQLALAQKVMTASKSLQTIVCFFDCPEENKHIVSYELISQNSCSEDTKSQLDQRLTEAKSSDIATIIYTSGTTGTPKGAMLSHANFMASFKIHQIRLDLGENDVSLCFLPLSHIFERAWTFLVLHQGGVNVYNSNPRQIVEELPKVKPTVMCVVPRFFEKTYDGIWATTKKWSTIQLKIFNWAVKTGGKTIEYQKNNTNPSIGLSIKHAIANQLVHKKVRKVFGGNIRYIPCSGASMSGELRRFFHSLGIFVNYGYGATETLATVSCMRSDIYDFENTGTIMPEVQVKLSDENMILVKGETVFQGYYKKPKETEEVLKDGWYYTGDEGELLPNNTLLMKERIKDIIKTSTGKYISPQKVELVLSRSELIEQVCVIGDNRRYLTALIVPVYDHLLKFLPDSESKDISKTLLVNHPAIIEGVKANLESIQVNLPKHEHIVNFALLDEAFSIDNSMMTSTLKVRRKQVNLTYKEVIEKLY